MSETGPSTSCLWASLSLITFIYLSTIWTIIAIKQFIGTLNLQEDFYKSRQPILNTIYIISFLFVLYILNPLVLFLSNVIYTNPKIPLFLNDIAEMIMFLVFFPRAWILWFDRSFSDTLKNWMWRREINGTDSSFLIRYRKCLPSPHVLVYTLYLLILVPIFIILYILPYLNIIPLYCHIMRVGLLLILFTATYVIVSNLSAVSDAHSIRSELLSSIQWFGIAFTLSHIFYIFIKETWLDQHWALLMEILFACVADLCVIYYTCCWTSKQYRFTQKEKFVHQLRANKGRRSSFCFSSLLQKRVHFQDIMDHKQGIQAFCTHLMHEFGLESMLFLLEVVQFKAIVRRSSNDTLEDNVPSLCAWHNTGVTEHDENALKHKFIVHQHVFSAASVLNITWLPIDPRMFSLTPYQIGLHLWDKYFEETADLCVNVSFGIRKEIYGYFKDLSQQQNNISMHDIQVNIKDETNALVKMYKIYDNAFTEVWRLIQTDSFHRFKETHEFRRLISVLIPEEAAIANATLIKMIEEEMIKERDRCKHLKKQRKCIRKRLSEIKSGKITTPVIVDALQNNFPDILAPNLNTIISFSPSVHSTDFMISNANMVASNSSIQYNSTASLMTTNSMVNSETSLNANGPNETITISNPMQTNNSDIKNKTFLELPALHYEQHSLPFFQTRKTYGDSEVDNDLPKLQFSHSL